MVWSKDDIIFKPLFLARSHNISSAIQSIPMEICTLKSIPCQHWQPLCSGQAIWSADPTHRSLGGQAIWLADPTHRSLGDQAIWSADPTHRSLGGQAIWSADFTYKALSSQASWSANPTFR